MSEFIGTATPEERRRMWKGIGLIVLCLFALKGVCGMGSHTCDQPAYYASDDSAE